jgi:DUF1680 family protein
VFAGPVMPVAEERLRLSPLRHGSFAIAGGLWRERQRVNRQATIPYGMGMLEESGTLENFRIAAGTSGAGYRTPLFRDSDLYKLLEAIAWERSHGTDPEQEAFLAAGSELIAAAQRPDGYLNTYVQVVMGDRRFLDPAHGHELYCAGHLVQASVADRRTGGGSLTESAERFASYLVEAMGERPDFVPGHPEIETALVELYRTGGDRRLLELASLLLARRGRRTLSGRGFGPEYFQDDVPFAAARAIRGHAVRALYLLAGATDLYTERGGHELLESIHAQWSDMVSAKTYLTGGIGSRHRDEAFGDPYELPPDRAYCETCAAIASVMWNWRLLLTSGDARYAALAERTLYNGFLAGVGLDGTSFFYVNPLQAREPTARSAWYDCACCPPNVMRLLASLEHYLVTEGPHGVQVHQYVAGRLRLDRGPAGSFECSIETDYPFGGGWSLRALAAPAGPLEVAVRVPEGGGQFELNGRPLEDPPGDDGYLRVVREWRAGDELTATFDMTPRVVRASAAVDGSRGCVAFERGPLVYCLEGVDVERRRHLRGVAVDEAAPVGETGVRIGGETVTALSLAGVLEPDPAAAAWPYASQPAAGPPVAGGGDGSPPGGDRRTGSSLPEPVRLTAVPYYAWANRGASAMRVWIPVASQR